MWLADWTNEMVTISLPGYEPRFELAHRQLIYLGLGLGMALFKYCNTVFINQFIILLGESLSPKQKTQLNAASMGGTSGLLVGYGVERIKR